METDPSREPEFDGDTPPADPTPPTPPPPPEPETISIRVKCGNPQCGAEFKFDDLDPNIDGFRFTCNNCGSENTWNKEA